MENCIYIISGPPGVGKSTVSKELAATFDKSAVIEGDMIYLMVKSGLVAPCRLLKGKTDKLKILCVASRRTNA